MQIKKVRVVKEDGYYYPEFKRFWWHRFIKRTYKEIAGQSLVSDSDVKFDTLKEAEVFAKDKITVITEIE